MSEHHAIGELNKQLVKLGFFLIVAPTDLKRPGSQDPYGLTYRYQMWNADGRMLMNLGFYGNPYCCGHGSVVGFPMGKEYPGIGMKDEAAEVFFSGLLSMPNGWLKGCFITLTLDTTQVWSRKMLEAVGFKLIHEFTGLHGTPVFMLGAQKKHDYHYPGWHFNFNGLDARPAGFRESIRVPQYA